MRKTTVMLLAGLASLAGLAPLFAQGRAPSESPPLGSNTAPGAGVGIIQRLDAQVPLELVLHDERGRSVRLGDLLGDKPVILNLIYYECPMLCNLAMDGLIRSLRGLSYRVGEEFTLITVSFDPHEGPELAAAAKRTALKRYGREGAGSSWHFLTGNQPALKALTEAVGFRYRYDPATGQYAHAAGLIILTPSGRVSRYLYGVEFAPRDVRLSLVEASQNKIGSITDQVLLLCYQYDPKAGKYGLLIHNTLRWAGVVTVGVIVGSITLMLARERRRAHARGASSGGATSPPQQITQRKS